MTIDTIVLGRAIEVLLADVGLAFLVGLFLVIVIVMVRVAWKVAA